MSITPKAVIAQVSIGNLSLEGLMAEDGTYGIAMPQLSPMLNIPLKNSRRYISGLLIPKLTITETTKLEAVPIQDSQKLLRKWRTTLNSKAVDVILLADFERLLRKLDKAGNKQAEQMVDDLVGLSMHQLFSDAFGLKFEKEERQAFLIDRQSHREDFHPKFTSWLKLDGCEGNQYAIEVNSFKRTLGLPIIPVDEYNSSQLRKLDVAYIKYDVLRTTGMSHNDVLKLV
jgi:hypothetical protein